MMNNNYRVNYSNFGTHKIICSSLKPGDSILDVGCNEGYLIKIFPKGKFTGIDYSAQSAKIALKNGYEQIMVGDLNNLKVFEFSRKFKVIIFGDILEHLIDPLKTIKYFVKNNLAKNGRIIVSLPNVANVTIRINLLFGKFNYTDSGILDKTHFHLYTMQSASRMLRSSGLKIITTRYSSNRLGFLIRIFPFLGPLLGFNLIFICQKK